MKLFFILFIFIGVAFSQSTSLLEFIEDNPPVCERGFGVGYGCGNASLTYSLGSNWTSNGINYYLYNIIFTNPASSVFPAYINAEIETNGHPPVITQYWNIDSSVPNGPDGPEDYASINLLSPLYPGSTINAGFVIQGDQASSVIVEAVTCDYSSYDEYCATLNQASTSSSTASPSSSTTGSSIPASTTGSSIPSTTTGSSSNSGCLLDASLTFTNSWSDYVNYYRQYSVNVQNIGTSVATSVDFAVLFSFGSIDQFWNMQDVSSVPEGGEQFSATLYSLQPGQSYSGLGFIWSINQTLYNEKLGLVYDGPNYIAPWDIIQDVGSC